MANKSQPPRITRADMEKEVLTWGKLEPIITDLKDFIRSTAKSTEYYLGNKIEETKQELRQEWKKDMGLMGQELRQEWKKDMNQMEMRLSEKIDRNSKQLDDHEARIVNLENARA